MASLIIFAGSDFFCLFLRFLFLSPAAEAPFPLSWADFSSKELAPSSFNLEIAIFFSAPVSEAVSAVSSRFTAFLEWLAFSKSLGISASSLGISASFLFTLSSNSFLGIINLSERSELNCLSASSFLTASLSVPWLFCVRSSFSVDINGTLSDKREFSLSLEEDLATEAEDCGGVTRADSRITESGVSVFPTAGTTGSAGIMIRALLSIFLFFFRNSPDGLDISI